MYTGHFSDVLRAHLIQNIGSLSAYPFAPYVADGLGRRAAIGLGALIMIGGTVVQTASQVSARIRHFYRN